MSAMQAESAQFPDPLPSDPLAIALAWQQWSRRDATQPNPDAMVLATAGDHGQPHARVVLCKEIVPEPGYLTFYTNYQSDKGRQLAANARAAVVMHWDHLHRQVRIEGPVVTTSAANSDAYFQTRYWQSRIGAWASRQSQPLDRRETLEREMDAVAARFNACDEQAVIPRPPHWGGFHLWAERVELWIEGGARIHERARWSRQLHGSGAGFTATPWSATRLQP
jgi:pyridoxamine 5'-phosphate oxidase